MTDFVIENGVLEKYTGNETKVVIPDSVTEIRACAFKGCKSLKEITIPDSVIDIGERAFEGCEDLVIKAPENSFAQKYAEENGMKFKVINR